MTQNTTLRDPKSHGKLGSLEPRIPVYSSFSNYNSWSTESNAFDRSRKMTEILRINVQRDLIYELKQGRMSTTFSSEPILIDIEKITVGKKD